MNLQTLQTLLPATRTQWRINRWVRRLPLLLLLFVLSACAVNEAPPAVVCESLNRGIYTIRLAGAVLVLISVVMVGGSLLGQKWLKTSVAIGGTVAIIIGGVVLLVQAPTIASTFLTAGGGTMPDIVALCAIT
jgi:hypothetical protein